MPDGLAVARQPVVGGERERAVLAVVERLDAVEQVAVGLVHVEAVLERVGGGDALDDETVGAVGADDHVLDRLAELVERRLRVLGGVDQHVLGLRPRALDLHVAAHARARVGDPVAALERRVRHRLVGERAALEVDQALVVGAVDLVAVARGALPFSEVSRYCAHLGSSFGFARDLRSM